MSLSTIDLVKPSRSNIKQLEGPKPIPRRIKRPQPVQTQPVQRQVEKRSPLPPLEGTPRRPTLDDFLAEARKISREKTGAEAARLALETENVAKQFAGKLFGKNVGVTSGVGKELTARAVGEQAKRLEPLAQQQAAELAGKELEFRRGEETRRRDTLFQGVLQGTIDKSQLSPEDWQSFGITNPNAIRTLADVDFANQMRSQGLDPNNPEDQASYTQTLKNQASNNLRNQIVANFAAANQGKIPNSQQIEMLMAIYGGDSGLYAPEELDALIARYNEQQWADAIQMAEAQQPPEGKVLCTELHNQGLLADEIYENDKIMGYYYARNYPHVVTGYHYWAKPCTKIMRKSKLFTYILKPFITAWALQMSYIVSGEGSSNILGSALHMIGVPICKFIGKIITKKCKHREEKVKCH
jgi:hypothetical protein